MSILELLAYYSDLLPIVISIVILFYKKRIGRLLWVILFYCLYSFINNSILLYRSNHAQSSFLFFYIFTIVEFCLFAVFIYNALSKNAIKRALLACTVLFTLFCLFNIFFQPKYEFDSLQTSIEFIVLLVFCILFLFEEINKPQLVFIYSSYKFWVILGILLSLSTTFFLYGFAASLPKETVSRYWFISNISNILRNIIFAISLIVYIKTPKHQKPLETGYQPFLN